MGLLSGIRSLQPVMGLLCRTHSALSVFSRSGLGVVWAMFLGGRFWGGFSECFSDISGEFSGAVWAGFWEGWGDVFGRLRECFGGVIFGWIGDIWLEVFQISFPNFLAENNRTETNANFIVTHLLFPIPIISFAGAPVPGRVPSTWDRWMGRSSASCSVCDGGQRPCLKIT